MHGGLKFYRGSAGAARTYLEADRSRADDYYLAEGTGLAELIMATADDTDVKVNDAGTLDGDGYENWVAGYDIDGIAKGRLRTDDQALRFVEVIVNGPKTWSLAAAVHPEVAAAYDAAQDRAAREIVSWLAGHATTRVGPRGRQVQVPVERLEAAVVRHHTSRAGDPHRHLHLQINARVFAQGRWRGLHSVGVADSIEAINGIGHAAVVTDPQFRHTLAALGYSVDPESGEIEQFQAYAPAFSARAAQINRNVDRFEAQWRTDHPGQEPGPRLRRVWDRRAWATGRPDKVIPTEGTDLTRRWLEDLTDAGFTPPVPHADAATDHSVTVQGTPGTPGTPVGAVDRDAVADLVVVRLGGRRSAWNAADIRGQVEKTIAALGVVTDPAVRRELAEDITHRTIERCLPLLDRPDVPEHIRAVTSSAVLEVEADIVERLVHRISHRGISVPPTSPAAIAVLTAPARDVHDGGAERGNVLDAQQRDVALALAGTHPLLLIEGAAGAGKTTTLAAASLLIRRDYRRLVVVTPTLKAAQVASNELGSEAFTVARLVHQQGFRWDENNRWTREPGVTPDPRVALSAGDVVLVDEAGMLDQDTARALLTIADETHAQIAFVGDRHQLPAVGRGGVLDLAARWTPPHAHLELNTVHRFTDPPYADLSLQMRTGLDPAAVFDTLLARGDVVIHPSAPERLEHLARLAGRPDDLGRPGPLIIADTREQVRALNAAIQDSRGELTKDTENTDLSTDPLQIVTDTGEVIRVGDRVATRRNDADLGVANRDQWTITGTVGGTVTVSGRAGVRTLPPDYAQQHVELAYAATAYGAQGDTVGTAHFLLDDTTSAASAYVAMTRGREGNTAHLVAADVATARIQWVRTFDHDRADLGPAHAAVRAADDLDRFGSYPVARPAVPRPLPVPDTRRHRSAFDR